MREAVVLSGQELQGAERLQALFNLGASEVLVSPLAVGSGREAALACPLRLVADVAKATPRSGSQIDTRRFPLPDV